jgi:hypothetical protein
VAVAATFDRLVDEIRSRSVEEKAELRLLLDRELIEARRGEMAVNHRSARREEKRGALKFSSKVSDPHKSLAWFSRMAQC